MGNPWVTALALVVGLGLLGRWVALRLGRTPGTRAWAAQGEQGRRFEMLVLPTLGALCLLVAVLPHAETGTIAESGAEQAWRLLVLLVMVVALVLFLGLGLLGVTLRPVPRWLLPRWARSTTRSTTRPKSRPTKEHR